MNLCACEMINNRPVENVEQKLDKFFGLRGYPHEFTEIDLDSLLRGDEKARIETLARAVQSGIYSPDEARHREDLPSVPGGWAAMPRTQAQNVPLDAAAEIGPAAPAAPAPPGVAGPSAAPAPSKPSINRIARLTEEEEMAQLERLIGQETLRRKAPAGRA
jgi:hypothetical protein